MRYLTIFGILTLTTVLCAAQQVPGGSYQQTCRDIGVRGSTLHATCDDGRGGRQATELRDFQSCGGQIQNINGSLRCTGTNGNSGPYQGRDDRGQNTERGQYGDRGQNTDRGQYGDRTQNGDRGDYGGPRGSYAQSCQNVSINGNTLQASCQKKNGGWRQTSLRNYSQCNRDIVNNNGKLQCTR